MRHRPPQEHPKDGRQFQAAQPSSAAAGAQALKYGSRTDSATTRPTGRPDQLLPEAEIVIHPVWPPGQEVEAPRSGPGQHGQQALQEMSGTRPVAASRRRSSFIFRSPACAAILRVALIAPARPGSTRPRPSRSSPAAPAPRTDSPPNARHTPPLPGRGEDGRTGKSRPFAEAGAPDTATDSH